MAHPSLNCSPDEDCPKTWMHWLEDQFVNLSLLTVMAFIMIVGFAGGVTLMLLTSK